MEEGTYEMEEGTYKMEEGTRWRRGHTRLGNRNDGEGTDKVEEVFDDLV